MSEDKKNEPGSYKSKYTSERKSGGYEPGSYSSSYKKTESTYTPGSYSSTYKPGEYKSQRTSNKSYPSLDDKEDKFASNSS
jgi:hypothetical protein